MYRVIYNANDNKIGRLERKLKLEIHQAIIFVENQFISSDIMHVAYQCRELENELHFPLLMASFDERGLNVVFDLNENPIANNSLEQFSLISKNINNAFSKVFGDDPDITWDVKITSLDRYDNLEEDDLPF